MDIFDGKTILGLFLETFKTSFELEKSVNQHLKNALKLISKSIFGKSNSVLRRIVDFGRETAR